MLDFSGMICYYVYAGRGAAGSIPAACKNNE
jgi:hypothetical protein